MNSPRREQAKTGMVPAHKRLETGNHPVIQTHDRLVEYDDLVALDGAGARSLSSVSRSERCTRMAGLKASIRSPAKTLGETHGKLGILEHILAPAVLVVHQRQADGGGEEYLSIIEGDGCTHGLAQHIGKLGNPLRCLF